LGLCLIRKCREETLGAGSDDHAAFRAVEAECRVEKSRRQPGGLLILGMIRADMSHWYQVIPMDPIMFTGPPKNLVPPWKEDMSGVLPKPGTAAVIRIRQQAGSEEWQQEQERRREDANRKRNEATKQQPRDEKGEFLPGPVSPDTTPGEQDYNRERKDIAAAAGVGEATAARAKALVEKRPDLADRVQAGELTLNEATRQEVAPLFSNRPFVAGELLGDRGYVHN